MRVKTKTKSMTLTKNLTYKTRRITTIQDARQDSFINGLTLGMVMLALTLLAVL